MIRNLVIDGAPCEDKEQIKTHIVSFFKNLYTESEIHRPFLHKLPLKSQNVEKAKLLEEVFRENEVLSALVSMIGDKTPGPNDLQLEVYRKSWHFMKKEIMEVFHQFHRNGYLDWRLNTTFITLIPKIKGPINFDEWDL